jgi:hypothetical protein
MKIEFEDKSYIELVNSANPGKVFIAIGAKSAKNIQETIVNSVELSLNELSSLMSGAGFNISLKGVEGVKKSQ